MLDTAERLIISEIGDFIAGQDHPGEPETPEQIQAELIARVQRVFADVKQQSPFGLNQGVTAATCMAHIAQHRAVIQKLLSYSVDHLGGYVAVGLIDQLNAEIPTVPCATAEVSDD